MRKIHRNPLEALILGDDFEKAMTRSRRSLLQLDIQLFSNGGTGGDTGTDGGNGDTGDNGGAEGGKPETGGTGNNGGQDDGNKKDDLDKIVQSRVDRLMADERKKTVNLEKELKKLRAEKMSADELKQLELDEKEKALADKQRKEKCKLLDKIKKLIKLLEQLNKLLLKAIELLGTATLLILAIKSLIEVFGY